MSNEFEIKVIDGNEALREQAAIQGQTQDSGPRQMHHHHMMMMMHSSESSGSESLSSSESSSGSLSSLSSITSESLSLSSESSLGSGDESLSSSSFSGSEESLSSSGSFTGHGGQGGNTAQNAPDQPGGMMDDGFFRMPGYIKRHRKHARRRRKMLRQMVRHDSSSESSNSLSSESSNSGSGSWSESVEASSNIDPHRNPDTGPQMMMKRMRMMNNLHLQPIPGLARELNDYIAEVNMQVPDIGGQAPVDVKTQPTPQTIVSDDAKQTSLKEVRKGRMGHMMRKRG